MRLGARLSRKAKNAKQTWLVCFTAARPSSSDLHGCSRHRTESVSRPPACAGQPSAAALYHRMTVRVLETWKHQLVAFILSYDKRA
jgi:hypothetical protein